MAIRLEKGQRINLEKSTGGSLTNFCVGVNWGAIEKQVLKSGFLGFGAKAVTEVVDVDLDLSCVMFDENGNLCDHLYSPLYRQDLLAQFGLPLGKLLSYNDALKHTGDDLEGDKGGDDGLDNEIITVDLTKVSSNVTSIFFFLNNVGQEDFAQIPYAKIRMYEGTPTKVDSVYAEYNVVAEPQYKGKKALVMGQLYKKDNTWKFNAVGDAYEDSFLGQTIQRIRQTYVK
ncbi:TerD family protein [Dysgonomonas sp. Marseille-P4677]|uniref:TerD family protein n=1 Tax=Dysgonomonas sp. Marseille-P4677 TaxID=2364790 RepID=UPI00191146C7|nr:TerD family protein [Dysgonomonas sp. Marseille-P4677]MBK5720876.1 TerD family protein [Dysgonomonas sp. Marseille-P4677]